MSGAHNGHGVLVPAVSIEREERDMAVVLHTELVRMAQTFANDGMRLTLQCSTRTYNQYLDHPLLVAGPWKWSIKDGVPFGDVYLYWSLVQDVEEIGKRFGTISASSGGTLVQ